MNKDRTKEEYLEALWYMAENSTDSYDVFLKEVGTHVSNELVDELKDGGLIDTGDDKISLTEKGRENARLLIRSHRIAERLVHDVLGVEFEAGACEFEHIVNADLVDSICTLLGHPRECPHGMPIPAGKCCNQHTQVVESSVISLDQLGIGESARIAYVYASNDQQLHRLENLLVRPGMAVKLHQRHPTFVIECENSLIAIDEEVAASVQVWSSSGHRMRIQPHGRRKRKRHFSR
jgi:DtxR family Mn-dependent transcriptional regulator